MKRSIKQETETNISIYRDGKYYHILRFATVGDDTYIHFVSKYRKAVKASDEVNLLYKKAPDHISYHKDGRVHLKHKDGSYHILPFKLPENFLSRTISYDLPWIAISFYDEAFEEHTPFFKILDRKPDNHVIIESHNVSLTIVVRLRDLMSTPLENRVIDFEVRIGGLIPNKPYPNLIGTASKNGKMYPIFNACLNPTNELIEELVLFSESEADNAGKLNEYLIKTFANS